MNERRNPRVGVVSDSNLQRLALAQAVKGHGYELCINTTPDKLDESALGSAELDVWVVDMQDEDDEFLDRLLDHSAAPILFGLEQAPTQGSRNYPRWERRVFVKLKETVGEMHEQMNSRLRKRRAGTHRVTQSFGTITDLIEHIQNDPKLVRGRLGSLCAMVSYVRACVRSFLCTCADCTFSFLSTASNPIFTGLRVSTYSELFFMPIKTCCV